MKDSPLVRGSSTWAAIAEATSSIQVKHRICSPSPSIGSGFFFSISSRWMKSAKTWAMPCSSSASSIGVMMLNGRQTV